MKKEQIFKFIQYPFDLDDNFSKVDLSKSEYLNMYYSWRDVKVRLIGLIGRNTLYTILRMYGFIDKCNRPKLERSSRRFLRVSSQEKKKWNLYYSGEGNTYITGDALATIMKLISHYHGMVA